MEKLNRELKEEYIRARVDGAFKEEVDEFCEERKWNLSAFVRIAIKESMEKVRREEAERGE